jgi:hypothetical protein
LDIAVGPHAILGAEGGDLSRPLDLGETVPVFLAIESHGSKLLRILK